MVRGKRQAVDSAFIKANASMDSLVEKEVLEDVSAFVNEFEENSEFKTTSTRKKLVERHHAWKEQEYKDMPGNNKSTRYNEDGEEIRPKFLSNHTHYSPTDPDAKISTKPGKPRQLNYAGQLAVDDKHHVITGACASTAGSKDSAIFSEIMDQTLENLHQNNIQTEEILADAGYSRSPLALSAIQKMSQLMRYIIKDSTKDIIPLAKEVKYINSVIELYSLRTIEKNNVKFTVKGNIDNIFIQPLLLIPFIENGFKHGDISSEFPYIINLSLDNQMLIFSTTNKIRFYSDYDDEIGEQDNGIGMENIQRRLELLYPNKYNITVVKDDYYYYLDLKIDLK